MALSSAFLSYAAAILNGPELVQGVRTGWWGAAALLAVGLLSCASAAGSRRWAWFFPAALWSALLAAGLASFRPSNWLADLVRPMEASVLLSACAVAALRHPRRVLKAALVATCCAMVVLFGIVHWTHAEDVAELVPAWMPLTRLVPYLTGSILTLAGPCLLARRTRRVAALLVAAMFASWLPLVHAARIVAAPADLGEWRFAVTALALCGALMMASQVKPEPLPDNP